MNALLTEIRRSLIELDKGLKGQLNMSGPMEDLIKAISINQWPGISCALYNQVIELIASIYRSKSIQSMPLGVESMAIHEKYAFRIC